jgi:hypothetical protein
VTRGMGMQQRKRQPAFLFCSLTKLNKGITDRPKEPSMRCFKVDY